MGDLYVHSWGSGNPVVLLLHGMGLHGGVWAGMSGRLLDEFKCCILAPDLRGHGLSPNARLYGYGQHAADVAELIPDEVELYVVGHSMGGAVALALASGIFGVKPKGVFAISTKISFTAEELDRLEKLSRLPAKHFMTKAEAISRFLKVGGIEGLVDLQSPEAINGVVEMEDYFRLAADNRTVLAAGPSLVLLHSNAQCPITYARGEFDPMVRFEELTALGAPVLQIAGAGHNPHMEQPQIMAELVGQWLRTMRLK